MKHQLPTTTTNNEHIIIWDDTGKRRIRSRFKAYRRIIMDLQEEIDTLALKLENLRRRHSTLVKDLLRDKRG